MIDRRAVLKAGGAGAAGALLLREPSMAAAVRSALASTAPAATPTVGRFVDPLPSLLDTALTATPAANAAYPGADYYEITMQPGQWQFHSQFSGAADTWGYFAGSKGIGYLGPTIVARKGRPVVVKYVNKLPATNRQFPVAGAIDPTIMGADLTPGRAMPHLHGGFTPPQFDGHPDGWWAAAAGGATSGQHGPRYATLPGAAANEAIFWYSNDQPATMLWYHDHARGITRLNVYVGLAGLYVIRDDLDTGLPGNALALPAGRYEVPLVIQDKQFTSGGKLYYPTNNGYVPNPQQPHAIWVPEFFGDTPVVNGVAYPHLEVEPRRYRFRIVNGAQARFFHLSLQEARTGKKVPLWMIGADQGLLPAAVQAGAVLLAPGERADVIVDFTALAGAAITLTNNAKAPYPGGDSDVPTVPELMQIRVTKALVGPDATTLPAHLALPGVPGLKVSARPEREIVMKETVDPFDQPIEVTLNGRHFDDPAEENPSLGSVEVWDFINATGDAHPMHIHLVRFQVVNRQPFNARKYLAAYAAWVQAGRTAATKPALANYLSGHPSPPTPDEAGWKDTARAYPGEVLRVKAQFSLPNYTTSPAIPGTNSTTPAEYVYHCHILEHEENDMMRPFRVVT